MALDLDGTLLQSDGSVSRRTREAVTAAAERGHVPIVATARPPRTAEVLLDGFLPDAPRIYYSGSLIRVGSDCLLNRTIPSGTARAVVDGFLARLPDARVSVEIDDRLFATHPRPHARPEDVLDVRTVLDREPVKIMLDLTHPDLPPDILDRLPGQVRAVISDGGTLAQIMHADVSKSRALTTVLASYGALLDDAVAFGDDTNDLEMIRDAGFGVAMANAVDAVKAVADLITLSNDEDGVAVAIEEHLLT